MIKNIILKTISAIAVCVMLYFFTVMLIVEECDLMILLGMAIPAIWLTLFFIANPDY